VDEPAVPGFPVRSLFTGGRAPFTLLLWCAFGMNLMVLYFVSSWTPTLISGAGMSVRQGVIATSLFQAGGTLCALGIGRLVDRLGPYALLLPYACAPVLLVILGGTADSPTLLMLALPALGVCVVGGQTGLNAFTGAAYPTPTRSTGAGWALGIGRLGSIAGSMIGGVLVAQSWSLGSQFLAAAVPSGFAVLALYLAIRARRLAAELARPAQSAAAILDAPVNP
jgi:AAHS family 4-hydroxybenzoate transporter-like MFS transporter